MLHLVTGGWHHCTPAWDDGGPQPHCKLYAPASGDAWYDAGAGEQRLHAGRLWLIPGGRTHRWRCPERFDLWWAHLVPTDPGVARLLAAMPDIRSWPMRGRQPVWRALADCFPPRSHGPGLAVIGLVLDLLATLPAPPANPDADRLEPVAAWLQAHALDNPPLARIAREAGLSPAQLVRVARRAWGEAPHARVLRLRLERARELLDDGLTVAAAARRCAFADAPALTRAFGRRYGLPPAAWRRQRGP